MRFNWPLSQIDAHLPQLSTNIFSPMPPMSSSCFGMISDEGGETRSPCLQKERGVVASSLCLILLNKKYIVKKLLSNHLLYIVVALSKDAGDSFGQV